MSSGGGARAQFGRAAAAARGAPAARGRGAPREAARAGRDPEPRRHTATEAFPLTRRALLFPFSAVLRAEPQDMSRQHRTSRPLFLFFSLHSHHIHTVLYFSLLDSAVCADVLHFAVTSTFASHTYYISKFTALISYVSNVCTLVLAFVKRSRILS